MLYTAWGFKIVCSTAMARIFSIQFTYKNEVQNAMVSMRNTPFYAEYTVLMLDTSIAGLLPNNKIISTSKDNFAFSDSTKENVPALMQVILHAIIGHMQTINA